jgi:peptide/nickel transport system permease protein
MVNYYARRVGMSVLVIFLSVSFAFSIFRLMPGGPAEAMEQILVQRARQAGREPNYEMIRQRVAMLTGIDRQKPIPVAYYEYWRDIILYQDFGVSIWQREPVFKYLIEKVPWSIFLSIYGLTVGRTIGIILGALMAYKEGTKFDSGLTIFTILNRGVPYYFVAILGLVVFGFNAGWFVTSGRTNPETVPGLNYPFVAGLLSHAALPVTTSIVAAFGGGLAFRGNAVREMGKSYIKLAHLRGVSGQRVAIRYVGRNAILPVYTGIVIGLASLFGSSIIIEQIFTYPAVGYATFNALLQRDWPLLMGAFVFFTTLTVVGVLIADLTYGVIDPRVNTGGDREAY